MTTDFNTLRARIQALTEERKQLDFYALNTAETRAAVERAMTTAAESYRGGKLRQAAGDTAIKGVFHLDVAASDVLPLLATVLSPKKVAEALTSNLAEVEDGPKASDRSKRVKEIEAELLELGREEERFIRAAEAKGHYIPRRADADASIVLAETLQ
ncbi:hypothetical protein HLB44_25455 [Aquincola sp. S2]|uniref:Uncharacterized protein n=1 Tax=Pseudaquabacterium terrae TaxID=2732868 RepID=A0ABX2EP94_9BURK|nr:hypothetical protein [Aquabacterium terrae]NRF70361.1 hypothetical protein [Aquabacterium terrae]